MCAGGGEVPRVWAAHMGSETAWRSPPIGVKKFSGVARAQAVQEWRASGCLGCSRRGGLSSAVSVVVGETWIPALEQRPERAVKRPRARLQQQVGAALGPLHLLTLSKALADHGVDCRFGQA